MGDHLGGSSRHSCYVSSLGRLLEVRGGGWRSPFTPLGSSFRLASV